LALPYKHLPDLDDQEALPADRHPAKVYLASLAPGSRRTMRGALDVVAGLLTSGRRTAETLPWHQLRYQHTTAIRTVLMERYAPGTANKMLAALRGVLKAAWRLGLMTAEDHHRTRDIPSIQGMVLPRGRALSRGSCVPSSGHALRTRLRPDAGTRLSSPCYMAAGCGGAKRQRWLLPTTTPRRAQ